MYDQFQYSGYKITTDPKFQDNRDHITASLKWELEKLYPQVQKGNKTVIRKLLHLIEKHPKNPQLKNFLSSAYKASGNYKKAVECNDWILKEHPNYLFGLLNKAHQLIDAGKANEVPEVIGNTMEIQALFPDRDEFHLAEVTGFYKLAVIYYTAINDLEQAQIRVDILEDIDASHPDTEAARKHLFYKRLEAGAKRFEEEEKTKINVKVKELDKSKQEQEKPIFNHPEIECLYQYDSNIGKEKLEKILALPLETLTSDLITILKDIVLRYGYFFELEENGSLPEEECFFACHAVYLLGELEAENALEAVLETFKFDSDFLHFWYFDLMSENFWYPLFKMGKNQLSKLKEFILIPNLDTYARAEIVVTVVQIALHYPGRRNEVINWLKEVLLIFISAKPDSGIIDSDQIGLMVGDIIEINGVELLDEIEELYKLGYVSEGMAGSFKSVKNDINKKPSFDYKRKQQTIFELYEDLNGFAKKGDSDIGKSDFDLQNFTKPVVPISKPVASSPKIGRNDPCICGSGKKYKKCCMNK